MDSESVALRGKTISSNEDTELDIGQFQSNVTVSNGQISGTLHYIDELDATLEVAEVYGGRTVDPEDNQAEVDPGYYLILNIDGPENTYIEARTIAKADEESLVTALPVITVDRNDNRGHAYIIYISDDPDPSNNYLEVRYEIADGKTGSEVYSIDNLILEPEGSPDQPPIDNH